MFVISVSVFVLSLITLLMPDVTWMIAISVVAPLVKEGKNVLQCKLNVL